MQQEDQTPTLDKAVIFIEKWAIIIIVLTAYLFLSFKIVYSLATPDPSTKNCGTGLFAALVGHFMLAGIAAIILAIRLICGKGFDLWTKIIIFLLVLTPPIISASLFN